MENTGKTIHEKLDMLTPSQVNMILLYLLICKEINASSDHDADAICKALQGELAEKADLEHVRRCPNAENPDIIEIYIDVMDGEFVPNFGLGVDYIRGLRELTSIPLDLHLMIKDPEYKLPWIGIHKEDIVTIHYESTFQVQRALDYLVPYGCKRFLAINPATPIGQIEEVLDYIDGVNLLMVNPGFAGQKIVPSTLRKAEKLQKFLQEMHREDIILEVDGNITKEHGATLRSCGASIFVAGTSSIFCTDVSHFGEKIREFRKAVE